MCDRKEKTRLCSERLCSTRAWVHSLIVSSRVPLLYTDYIDWSLTLLDISYRSLHFLAHSDIHLNMYRKQIVKKINAKSAQKKKNNCVFSHSSLRRLCNIISSLIVLSMLGFLMAC